MNDTKQYEHDQTKPKIWNSAEIELLKKWGEISASYRILHYHAHRKFKHMNYAFTIPAIILSTITGAANISQKNFPEGHVRDNAILIIGTLNIGTGIITTVAQFLRVSELQESHRIASIAYGKLSRNISTELSLPPYERSYSGSEMVQLAKVEMDRLVEQSPIIPLKILEQFNNNKRYANLMKPDLLYVENIEEYKPNEDELRDERISNIILKTIERFKELKERMNKLRHQASQLDGSSKQSTIYKESIESIQHAIDDMDNKGIITELIKKDDEQLMDIMKARTPHITQIIDKATHDKNKRHTRNPFKKIFSKTSKEEVFEPQSMQSKKRSNIRSYEEKYDENDSESSDIKRSNSTDKMITKFATKLDDRISRMESEMNNIETMNKRTPTVQTPTVENSTELKRRGSQIVFDLNDFKVNSSKSNQNIKETIESESNSDSGLVYDSDSILSVSVSQTNNTTNTNESNTNVSNEESNTNVSNTNVSNEESNTNVSNEESNEESNTNESNKESNTNVSNTNESNKASNNIKNTKKNPI